MRKLFLFVLLFFSLKAHSYEMEIKELQVNIHINSDASVVFLYLIDAQVYWDSEEFPLFFLFDGKRFDDAKGKMATNIYEIISFKKNGRTDKFSVREDGNYYNFTSWQKKGRKEKEHIDFDLRYTLFNGIDVYNDLSTLRFNIMGNLFNSPVGETKVIVTIAEDLKIVGGNAYIDNQRDDFIGVVDFSEKDIEILHNKVLSSNSKFNIIVDYRKKEKEDEEKKELTFSEEKGETVKKIDLENSLSDEEIPSNRMEDF